jgi:hypothetical protein
MASVSSYPFILPLNSLTKFSISGVAIQLHKSIHFFDYITVNRIHLRAYCPHIAACLKSLFAVALVLQGLKAFQLTFIKRHPAVYFNKDTICYILWFFQILHQIAAIIRFFVVRAIPENAIKSNAQAITSDSPPLVCASRG